MLAVSSAGHTLSSEIIDPILKLARKSRNETISEGEERDFLVAYGKLCRAVVVVGSADGDYVGRPFESAVSDCEQLLNHAAAVGIGVPSTVMSGIINARKALSDGGPTESVKAEFYASYTALSGLLGQVSAETLRNCVSIQTRRSLAYLSYGALLVTAFVAAVSIFTFTTDHAEKKIKEQTDIGNELAANIRSALFPVGGSVSSLQQKYFSDPCAQLDQAPSGEEKVAQSVDDVTKLQKFAANTRDLRSNAIKLNSIVAYFVPKSFNECDPFDECKGLSGSWNKPDEGVARKKLEINPTIANYTSEALCKIQAFQSVRSFATNVSSNYTTLFGAILSYALPILYAFLGALAYRLRAFSEAIRKKTYEPSLSDTARLITAVIAGAIAGLFGPAKGLDISPLAAAFLVGYGVEIFFRFLDSLTNAFTAGTSNYSNSTK